MTKKIGNILVIEEENHGKCELCGNIAELRPYGPNFEKICFPCGQKQPLTTFKRFADLYRLKSKKPN